MRDYPPGGIIEMLPNGATTGVDGGGVEFLLPQRPGQQATLRAAIGVIQ